jgi:hypothetical protein
MTALVLPTGHQVLPTANGLNRTMTALVLPTGHQVLPTANSLNRTMTALVLPTGHQVLPTANSLGSRAPFWRYSTLGSMPEHKFCNNKFNLFENMSQQNRTKWHDFGEEI